MLFRYDRLCGRVSAARLLMISLLIGGVAAHAASAVDAAQADVPLALAQALAVALDRNPALAGAEAGIEADRAKVNQQGALPDPRLTVGLMNLPGELALDKDPMSQVQVGISQALPYPGTLSLTEEAASYRVTFAEHRREQLRRALMVQVRRLWWQLFYLDRALETVVQNRRLLEQSAQSLETLYSVGRGLQQDLLLVQLEQSRLDDQALELRAARRVAEAQFNRLLNRPASSAVTLPQIEATALAPPSGEEALSEQVLQTHPDILAARASLEAARAMREVSSKERYPDFVLGATYGMRDGREDLTSVQLSMSLPIYSGRKQARAEDQRQAELMAARYHLADEQARILTELGVAVARYQRSYDQVALFERAILPKARQTVETLVSAFQSGKADFAALMKVQATLFNYENQYWQAYSRAQQARAQLWALTGEASADE